MSNVTSIPTVSLRPDDTLLVDASMVTVASVEPDEVGDGYWLFATCCSGNFEQWETPRYVDADAQWQVLNADREVDRAAQ